MTGYKAAAEIRRAEGERRHVPIIALTAHALEDNRLRTIEAGMDDYLTKPVNLGELEQVLERWTSGDRQSGAGPITAISVNLPGNEVDRLDPEMMRMVLEHTPGQVEAVRRAANEGDATALSASAHRLKGGAVTCGFERLSRLSAKIEEAAKAGDLSGIPAAVERLVAEHDRLMAEITHALGQS